MSSTEEPNKEEGQCLPTNEDGAVKQLLWADSCRPLRGSRW